MFTINSYLNQPINPQPVYDQHSQNAQATKQALYTYRLVGLKYLLGKLITKLTGRKQRLLDLNQVKNALNIRNRYHLGIQAVPLAKIQGTEGRSQDFDAHFNPANETTRDRWLNVARAYLLGIGLPPVELIQVGEIYFVRDGHHRISVARAFGQEDIDAEVTVWQVQGQLPWEQVAGFQFSHQAA